MFTSWAQIIDSLSAWAGVSEAQWTAEVIKNASSRLQQIELPASTLDEWLTMVEQPEAVAVDE